MLKKCQKPLDFKTIFEYTAECIKLEKKIKEIAKGKRRHMYHIKSFATAVAIIRQREVFRSRSKMRPIKTETLNYDNNSTVEQSVQSIEKSKKCTETRSVAIPKVIEIYGEVGVDVGGGIDIPFVATGKVDVKTKAGIKHNWGTTVTNTISEETTVIIPRQTLKCRPGKRVEMKWTFFHLRIQLNFLLIWNSIQIIRTLVL